MGKLEVDMHVGRRAESRMATRSFAQLVTHDQVMPVHVLSLSPRGAGLRVDDLPLVGGDVVLSLRACDLPARVVWAAGHSCGVVFAAPAPAELVASVARPVRSERYVRDFIRARREAYAQRSPRPV